MSIENDDGIICSFCTKPQDKVKAMVAGNGVYICNECVDVCREIVEENIWQSLMKTSTDEVLFSPREIKEQLDEYVIGQEDTKRTLSVAVYNHYKRLLLSNLKKEGESDLQKSNILMVGHTGSGKTLLAQTLSKILDVPLAIADATSLTEAGYVGEDVESILLRLVEKSNYDISRAERGIIYIDEIDKIAVKKAGSSGRDVGGEGVQQALLKIIEGTEAFIPLKGKKRSPDDETIRIDTSNILFICGGAFVGLDKIIEARTTKSSLGFGAYQKTKEKKTNIHHADLAEYGLIPEFAGRIPIIVELEKLDEEALVHILTEPKNAVTKQYQRLFESDGYELIFSPEGLRAIAQKALTFNSGARGLRSILDGALTKISYELFSTPLSELRPRKVIVDEKTILKESPPLCVF